MNAPIAMRSPRRFPGVLIAIVALAALVRCAVIGRDALWLDEGYSWWDGRQPLHALWSLVPTCDPHPPLYFALLHGWMAVVGDSTIALRALSTIFGLATVAVVYLAGRELDRARGRGAESFGIGAIAALFFALTPFQAYFAVEARPYALLCLGAASFTYGCLATLRAGRDTERGLRAIDGAAWCALFVGGAIVVWTNNTAVLMLGAATIAYLALWTFDPASRRRLVPVVAAGIAIAVVWAPDWPLLIAQGREVAGDFWIARPSFAGLTYELHYLVGLDSTNATGWMALALLGGLLAIGRAIGWRWALMTGALAILPVVLNVAISALLSPILLARALIVATPALAIVLASATMLLRGRSLRAAAAAMLVMAHALALANYLAADHVKEPWKAIVARLATVAKRAPVLVVPNELVLPLAHEAAAQRVVLRVHGLPADYPATDLPARYPSGKCAPSVVDQDLATLLEPLRAERSLVLLTRRHNTYDPDEAVAAALRQAGYTLRSDDVFQPGDLRVMRFVRPAS